MKPLFIVFVFVCLYCLSYLDSVVGAAHPVIIV
jgi:hypothetical protein